MMNRKMIFETIKLDLQVGIYNEKKTLGFVFDQVTSRQSELNLAVFTDQIDEYTAKELHRNLDDQIKYINAQIQFVNSA